jgi:hypothetical protein
MENARTAAPRTFQADTMDHTFETWMPALVGFTSCQGDMIYRGRASCPIWAITD